MNNWSTLAYALIGGILPAILWLIFWLQEDRKRPEPKRLILRTFIFGMMAVLLVVPFQKSVDSIFPGLGFIAFLLWAILEEGFKFGAAYFGGLKSKEDNEPVDPLIYMITAALGFVALENSLFIITPLLDNDAVMGVIVGNMRFVGASLLHTFSSSIIGVALGLSFYKKPSVRGWWALIAFIIAIVFHTIFNLIIALDQTKTVYAFGVVWVGLIVIIFLFEKVKAVARGR